MTSRQIRLALACAISLSLTASASAAEQRHQFLEPIQPDHPRKEKITPAPRPGKLCYCRIVHERNAAGRLTWKAICSEDQPERGARTVRAADCGSIRNTP